MTAAPPFSSTAPFDHEAFYARSIAWTDAHVSDLEPFCVGLTAFAHRAAALFRYQGKSIRAAALRRLLRALRPVGSAERRRRQGEWRQALERRALAGPANLVAHLADTARHAPPCRVGTAWGHPDLWRTVWMDIERAEILHRFDGVPREPPDPALLDLLLAQAARQVSMVEGGGGIGCQAVVATGGLLLLSGHRPAAAMAAMVGICFDPNHGPAHALLVAADPTMPHLDLHQQLVFRLA